MYRAMDDEVFLAPESIISGVLEFAPAEDPTEDLDFDEGLEEALN
jgi:hypothetical protein